MLEILSVTKYLRYWIEVKKSFSCEMVRYQIERRSVFEPLFFFVFDRRVSFKFWTKFGTNFGHSALTVVNQMKPRGLFILQKAPFSVLIPLTTHFEQFFDKKCTKTLAVVDNILWKVKELYSIKQLLSEWWGNKQLWTKKVQFCLI